jgi:PiT family inorganic phosphate transporter
MQAFLVPLLLSPLMAAGLGVFLYKIVSSRESTIQTALDCACVVETTPVSFARVSVSAAAFSSTMSAGIPSIVVSDNATCDKTPSLARLSISQFLKKIHIASAVTICFARAVNDTPKLAALLVAAHFTNQKLPIVLVGLLMAVGGLVFAKKVATTMSQKVTRLDDKQGLTANLITTCLVLMASKFGLPVSTTHVSVGAIAGVGASAGTLNWQALRSILLSWLATLPLALVIAWSVSQLL